MVPLNVAETDIQLVLPSVKAEETELGERHFIGAFVRDSGHFLHALAGGFFLGTRTLSPSKSQSG
jgi:hypothetical protein